MRIDAASNGPWLRRCASQRSRGGNAVRPTSTILAALSRTSASATVSPMPPKPPVIRQTPPCRSTGAAAGSSGAGRNSSSNRRAPRSAATRFAGSASSSSSTCVASRSSACSAAWRRVGPPDSAAATRPRNRRAPEASGRLRSRIEQVTPGNSRGITRTGPSAVDFSG